MTSQNWIGIHAISCGLKSVRYGKILREIWQNSVRFSYTSLWSSHNIVCPFSSCKNLVKTTIVCDLWLFLHKICCKMVWKFCEIWIFYGNCLPDGPNSVRFHLTVWDMACMDRENDTREKWLCKRWLKFTLWKYMQLPDFRTSKNKITC